MIICPNCHTKNNDKFTCCYNCGAVLKDQSMANRGTEDEAAIGEHVTKMIENGTYDINKVRSILKNKEISLASESEDAAKDYDKLLELTNTGRTLGTDETKEAEKTDPASSDSQKEVHSYTRVARRASNSQDEQQKPLTKDELENSLIETIAGGKFHKTLSPEEENQRRRKERNKNAAILINRVIAFTVLLAILVGLGFLFIRAFRNDGSSDDLKLSIEAAESEIYVSGAIEETYHKIHVVTNADTVSIFDVDYPVVNEECTIDLKESDIYYACKPDTLQPGETFDAEVTLIAKKENAQDVTTTVTIDDIKTPAVPVTLNSRSSTTIVTTPGTTETFSFTTEPGASVKIDGVDAGDAFDVDSGLFSSEFVLPENNDEIIYTITVELANYSTRYIPLKLTIHAEDNPSTTPSGDLHLEIDQEGLLQADENGTVTITGEYNGSAEDINVTSKTGMIEVRQSSFSDNGTFELQIQFQESGIFDITIEQLDDSSLNQTLYCQNQQEDITKIAQGLTSLANYNNLVSDPTMAAGRIFVIRKATIISMDFVEVGQYNVVLETTIEGEPCRVSATVFSDNGLVDYEVGGQMTVFGNRSGVDATGTMPHFLSASVYKW